MGSSDARSDRRPAAIGETEWRLRLDLAACYQLFDHLGWAEGIFNHISLRVPGAEKHYLVNPFGLHYAEVTASNLVKVDLAGDNVDPGPYRGNPAAFAIHGAIHAAREDAHCLIHTHATAGVAIAIKEHGLRHDDFYGALLAGRVAYHDFEGVTVRQDERARLVASLGDKHVMILRNHGLLAAGEDLPRAFVRYWNLVRACEVQVAAAAMGGPDRSIGPRVLEQAQADQAAFDAGGDLARIFFDAMVRRMEMARAGRYVDWRG